VRNSDNIDVVEVNNATLIATKGQVSLLDGLTVVGSGNTHIKADLGAQSWGGAESFTVQTTGQNYVAAGVGRDTIALGQGSGTDVLIYKYNDSNYGGTRPWWDVVENFETGRDKLAFITTWKGTAEGPTSVVQSNVRQGETIVFGDFTATDGIITYTGAGDVFTSKSVLGRLGLILKALDAAIGAGVGGMKANDIWAYADKGSTDAGQQSAYLFKVDGKPGHNADYKEGGGYQNDTPGDTVIELMGVSMQSGATLAGILNPPVDNINWGSV
jgi:hypothetical protein